MSSILTNTGSMVALQTLKNVNKNLGKVQNEISTGLKVATAKDNSLVLGDRLDHELGRRRPTASCPKSLTSASRRSASPATRPSRWSIS